MTEPPEAPPTLTSPLDRMGLRVAQGLLAVFLAGGVVATPVGLVADVLLTGIPGSWTLLGLLWMATVIHGLRLLAGRRQPPGIRLEPEGQPTIFAQIRAVAARLAAPVPERVLLVPEAGVLLLERRPLLWWIRRRELYVGLALLEQVSEEGWQAALAQELAVQSRGDRRKLAPFALALHLERLLRARERSWLALPGELLARTMLHFAQGCCRGVEKQIEAQGAAVLGSAESYRAGLREATQAAQAFGLFVRREVLNLLLIGGLPDNLYQGFRVWLGKAQEVHGLPEPVVAPGSAAKDLLRDLQVQEQQVSPFLVETLARQGLHEPRSIPRLVPWSGVVEQLLGPAQKARTDQILRILDRFAGRSLQLEESIAFYLSQLEVPEDRVRLAGRLDPNLGRFPPVLHPQIVRGIHARHLGTLVGSALVERRGYHWDKDIATPLIVVGQDGQQLDPFSLVRGLLEGSLDVGRFRMVLFDHGLFGRH